MKDLTLEDSPTDSTAARVTLENVAVHYGGVRAVDGISLKLEPGIIYGIIGPNGSGKTTLLGALTRMVNLTSGSIWLGNIRLDTLPPYRILHMGVGRTFQTVRLLESLTVRENVLLGFDAVLAAYRRPGILRYFPRAESVGSDHLERVLEETRLTDIASKYPKELSYGDQRRVEIARALATDQQLLLLDEPSAGMNRAEKTEITELMRHLKSDGLTQLIVEHDVEMMLETCDYMFAMNAGRLIAQGEPRQVVRDRAVQAAFLGRNQQHA